MKRVLIGLIRLYQKIPGPWHQYCRYIPTCSDYAILALEEHGFWKGSFLAIKRILRCNPLGSHGLDPVPCKKEKKNEESKIV